MSESTTQAATELASQYSVQVTEDLERNVKEQERISAEITSAQQQLAGLQHDHALLVNMQQALGIASPPTQPATVPEPAADAATVPAPRGSATTEPAAAKRTRGKKAAGASKRATAAKPGGKPSTKPAAKAGKAAARKPAAKKATAQAAQAAQSPQAAQSTASVTKQAVAQPTLVELVRKHLTEQSEPRSAAEVTTALGRAHSGRTVKTTVVRTTLEGLVAKNQAQRTKQGTSVYYTATEAPEAKRKQDAAAETASTQGAN